MSSAPSANRRCDRAVAAAVAIQQIFETAAAHELPTALEDYLREEFIDAQRQARADCEFPPELW